MSRYSFSEEGSTYIFTNLEGKVASENNELIAKFIPTEPKTNGPDEAEQRKTANSSTCLLPVLSAGASQESYCDIPRLPREVSIRRKAFS